MRLPRCLIAGACAAVSAAGADLTAGWKELSQYRAERALKVFDPALNSPDPVVARKARFGRAIALLDRQPVTPMQIEEARVLFTNLADAGDDDAAQGARFFLGRVAQHHQQQPDAEEAARQFRRLIAEHEDSLWAQSALSRLALLEIYELNRAAEPAARIASAKKLLVHARNDSAKSELHLAIANAVFFFRLPAEGALPHLLAAEALGRLEWSVRSEVLVQIGELSRLSGDRERAARFYRTFLTENPRDLRNYIVKERLAEVE